MLTAYLAQANDPTFWLPKQASTVSDNVDGLFTFVYWLSVFFFLVITAMVVYFTLKYRHRPGQTRESAAGHSTALELTWTIIPTLLVLPIFYYGFRGFMDMQVEPPNPYEINVIGKMWSWTYEYPGGVITDELHIPKDVPVRFVLRSDDVLHSFFIPEFRTKKDVVPGRYNRYWVKATQLSPEGGTKPWDIFCAEYCGDNHSTMLSKVWVHEKPEFDAWFKKASDPYIGRSLIQVGETFYKQRGCATCHSTEKDAVIQGPSFRNLFGSQVEMTDGTKLTADENYIRESVLYPQAKIHKGFGAVMPSFLGQFTDRDIDAINWFLKSISDKYPKENLGPGGVIGTGSEPPAGGKPTPNLQPGAQGSPAGGGASTGTGGAVTRPATTAPGAKPGTAAPATPPKPSTGIPDPAPTPAPK